MENLEDLMSVRVSDGFVTASGDGSQNHSSAFKENENLGHDLLEDLDSYLEDINNRLTVSRMVSDSVVKGIVNAVEQEAVEKIAEKELQVSRLKERLHFDKLGVDEIEFLGSPVVVHHGPRREEQGFSYRFSEAMVEHDELRKSLGSLKGVAREQIEKVMGEIYGIRGCNSISRIGSGSGLLGLGGILQEKVCESWVGVDATLDALKATLDNIWVKVDNMLHLAKASLCEWQQDWEFQGELEAMVIRSCIKNLQEDFEEKLWEQNACFGGSQSLNWNRKINEISSLCKGLDVISKSLSGPETGLLTSHGSYDMDHFHRKALNNHILSSTSLREENGKSDESKTGMPENWDAAQLKHMKTDELVSYFNTVITKMKRNHESTVQQITEEYFTFRREYLKERDSALQFRNKEFDLLRKNISEVVMKLDNILVENGKLPACSNNAKSFVSMKDRLENLLLVNRQLRDSLTVKEKKLECISSQVSDAAEKLLQHSSTEMDLVKFAGNLKSTLEDAHIEAFVSEEIYKCVLRAITAQTKCDNEESEVESTVMQEIYKIIFREAAQGAEATGKCEIEDSDMDYLIMEGLCGVIFRETIKDAESQFNNLNTKYLYENENRVSLEMKALEREKKLSLEVEEKERLKHEVLLLAASLEEKEKVAQEVSAALMKERGKFELASQELHNLRDHVSQQQILISERNMESDLLKHKLKEALKQIEVDKVEREKLNEKLELTLKELREVEEERNMLLVVIQEKKNDLLLVQAKEKEQMKKMEAVIVLVYGLSKALDDIESKVGEGIKKNNSRLEYSSSQLSSLNQKANMLRRTGLLCKQRLERRCSNLQMAEAEVDLLGDEVDSLLILLEKVYIALDHYLPILQHYPGIIEILELVRRELSGESHKTV
ncbi:WPP domain-associated protein-like [Cornus florida]|uniref:WPP domain-associated protein-like n=1 Tax=Cornus florida TaxID=4283 RepID=UPI00289FEEE3|nr:WPP domain-associated protein-like [Cornus florida]XP_059668313.1 WPP domain-associated protein-like [Cornus florida]XP_059668320.1 WPP domain-associated protein-like [Cornus florida]XP_059668327.1 WPP domain-associated protein-like [Cornus florida]